MKVAFNVYKGLQKPLVFKSFKGQYIYWGVGSILVGLLLCMILSSLLGLFAGILILVFVTGGGLCYTAIQQKKGLHTKAKHPGIFIHQSNYQKYDQN